MGQTNLFLSEEQLLRIFRSLYFEIKCSNNKKDCIIILKSMFNDINRIIELSCWAKG